MNTRKAGLLSLIVLLLALLFAFDLDRVLTLEGIKASRAGLAQLMERSWPLVAAGYFLLYVLIAAVSFPGAAVMTLAGGALFGLAWGTLLVSFASSIGATLAFLVARYLLRDAVQRRFGEWSRAVDKGFARDGAFYLFTLRLLPLPFFLVNLVMGLTPIRVRTFYWVSQLAMLGATLVYVNAGTQLARVEALADIVSPSLLLSFALLGVFPLLARRVLAALQARRAYAKWQRPRRFERNLVVIGGGAAGLVSAYIGATVKASVTLVEARRMGGDCLNTGCVPSKALIRSARLAHEMRHAERLGLEAVEPRVDFRRVIARVQDVVRAIAPHDSVERYSALGVEVLEGHARIVDPWTVEVHSGDGRARRLTTRAIVIAAGAEPYVPPLPGLDEVGYLTSDTLWDALAAMERPPERLVVLGGGPIGCELAQCLQRLGSQVTQVELMERLLVREDPEVAASVQDALARDGVEVLCGWRAVHCERDGERRFLVLEREGVQRRLGFDTLLCAVGRKARLGGYGLEELGVPVAGTVVVNEYLETLYPNIYAAGDVAGPFQFTHAAAHQAWYAAVNALFGAAWKFRADYTVIPATTFTDPEVARVGLNEQDALARGIAYEVTRYGIADLDRAIADGAAEGFVQVLTVPGKDRILGATIVGAHAGELLAEFVLAMRHGLGLNKILGTIHSYPTLAEASKYAAGEWKRAHAPERLLRWVERYHAWRRGASE